MQLYTVHQTRVVNHLREQHDIDEPLWDTHFVKIKLLELNVRASTCGRGPADLSFNDMASFVKLEKNTNKEMYAANEAFHTACQLCNARLQNASALVRHCVAQHSASEMYLSRLSDKMITNASICLPKTRSTNSKGTYAFCVFCEDYKRIQRSRWVEHLTSHTGRFNIFHANVVFFNSSKLISLFEQTRNKMKNNVAAHSNGILNVSSHFAGEFQYYCHKCQFHVYCKRDHEKSCEPLSIERKLYLSLDFDRTNCAFGYICKLCNFAQLTEERIRHHVHDQHDVNNDDQMSDQYFDVKILDLTLPPKGRHAKSSKNAAGQRNQPMKLGNLDVAEREDPEAEQEQNVCESRAKVLAAGEAKNAQSTSTVDDSDKQPNADSVSTSVAVSDVGTVKNIHRNMYMAHPDCPSVCCATNVPSLSIRTIHSSIRDKRTTYQDYPRK